MTTADLADHAVPGMVIDPGHDLRLGTVGQERPAMTSICHSAIGASRSHRW